jgi:hypothetical protein
MADDEIKVTITLRKHVGERLRKMCHNRGLTASLLIDAWVFEHDDNGRPKDLPKSKNPVDQLIGEIIESAKGKR